MLSSPIFPRSLPAHPRLLVDRTKFDALRSQVQADAVSARIFSTLQWLADQIMDQAPVERQMTGRRLLGISRLCVKRVSTLAMVAVITGEQRYVERACREMRAAANFTDWNPSHYLDTAEMTLALAIGYDWLYDRLSPEDRTAISAAIYEKGLRSSFDSSERELWWMAGTNNWNQVCHAGLVAGAIAVAEVDPGLAEETVRRAIENLHHSAESYAPDGAYVEGPIYWDYGTSFHVILIAALESLCGHTFGMDAFPGFLASAEYIDQVTAPSGHFYNYADSEEHRSISSPKFWFARHLQRADLVRFELDHLESELHLFETSDSTSEELRLLSLALLWWDALLKTRANQAPLHWAARGINPVAVHRSAWNDPDALYVGVKGGSASSPHAHMDAGSFILEADGVRWAIDMDKQDYESLEAVRLNLWDGSQDGDRWKIFRIGSDGHNILRFNDSAQNVQGKADIVRFQPTGPQPHSVVDLSSLYPEVTCAVARGVAFLDNRAVLLQDEWTAGEVSVNVTWQMLTRAEVTVEKQQLTLRQDGKTFRMRILAPDPVEIEVRDVSQPLRPYDAPNPGVRQIVLRTQTAAGAAGIFRILFSAEAGDEVLPSFRPVLDWSAPLAT